MGGQGNSLSDSGAALLLANAVVGQTWLKVALPVGGEHEGGTAGGLCLCLGGCLGHWLQAVVALVATGTMLGCSVLRGSSSSLGCPQALPFLVLTLKTHTV